MMRNKKVLIALIAILLATIACASANPNINMFDSGGQLAGFWIGLWHGIIAWPALIVSIFNHNISIYDIYNTGFWYNFGFLLGLGVVTGGSASASSRN